MKISFHSFTSLDPSSYNKQKVLANKVYKSLGKTQIMITFGSDLKIK